MCKVDLCFSIVNFQSIRRNQESRGRRISWPDLPEVTLHKKIRVKSILYTLCTYDILIEKAKDIKYLYAWLDIHPHARAMLVKANFRGIMSLISILSWLANTLISKASDASRFISCVPC